MHINLPGVGKREHNAQRLPEYPIKSTLPNIEVAVDRRITRIGMVLIPVTRVVFAAASISL